MAAITATVDLTYDPPRVSVSLSGWSADGPVAVQRVHADTSVHEVYMPDVSGGVSQAYDYWPVAVEAITYQALNGSTLITSASVTVADDRARLIAAGLPDVAVEVVPTAVPGVDEGRPVAVMESPFREYPKGEYGVAQAGSFTLKVRTSSAAELTALRTALRTSGVALLRMPYTDLAWQWVLISRWPRDPMVHFRRQNPAVTDSVADWREWALSCLIVGDPEALPFGDPSASYQRLVDSGRTYQQLLDWKGAGATTYLDVLKGGF